MSGDIIWTPHDHVAEGRPQRDCDHILRQLFPEPDACIKSLFDDVDDCGITDKLYLDVRMNTHPDHVGNLRTPDGRKAFPNAVVYAPKSDWDFFVRNDPDLSYMPVPPDFRQRFAAAIKRSVEPIAGDVELYEAGAEIVPGLTTITAPGDTPGMATSLVHSRDDQLLLTADLAYHPVVNIDNPWRPGPDRDKDTALASRRRIFDMAATDRLLVLGSHYPFPGLGRMLKTDAGYAWVPAGRQF